MLQHNSDEAIQQLLFFMFVEAGGRCVVEQCLHARY